MIVRVASFLNLAGPGLIVIAIIIAVLAAPGVIALPIVFYLERRRKKATSASYGFAVNQRMKAILYNVVRTVTPII